MTRKPKTAEQIAREWVATKGHFPYAITNAFRNAHLAGQRSARARMRREMRLDLLAEIYAKQMSAVGHRAIGAAADAWEIELRIEGIRLAASALGITLKENN